MYMQNPINENDLVFTMDKEGNLKAGGFQLNMNILDSSLKNSHLSKMVIPSGLFINQQYNQEKEPISKEKYQHCDNYINETLYDKLLELVEIKDRKKYAIKSKKKKEKKLRATKKVKKLKT